METVAHARVESPLVSVITPSYNRADLVVETLRSLSAQTMTAWECIVVDDGSTDSSAEVISNYALGDTRVKFFARDRGPKGACTCRNIAIEHSTGRYLLFLDSDDLLAPFCLQQRVEVMQSDPSLDFAIFPLLLFDGDPGVADKLWNIETGEDKLLRLLHLDPICQGTGTLWRRDSFTRMGMWDEDLAMWQDIELHLRAFTGGYRFATRFDLPPDGFLRETGGSMSRGAYFSRVKLESRASVVRKAAALLREAGRSELIPEVRYICSSVVLGAVSSGNLDLARELRAWAAQEGVLTRRESWRLRLTELSRASRLDRIRLVRRACDYFVSSFRADSTIGLVRTAAHFHEAQSKERAVSNTA